MPRKLPSGLPGLTYRDPPPPPLPPCMQTGVGDFEEACFSLPSCVEFERKGVEKKEAKRAWAQAQAELDVCIAEKERALEARAEDDARRWKKLKHSAAEADGCSASQAATY